jgi:hypothetical protein
MSKSMTSSDFLDGMPPTPIPSEHKPPLDPKSTAEDPRSEESASDLRASRMHASAQTSNAGLEATEKADDKIEAAKASGADTVASLAGPAASAADSLEEKSPLDAKYVRSAAEGAERSLQSLRDWKVSDVGSSISDFAISRPVAIAGLGIIAGYIIGRLVGGSDRSA